MELLFKIIANIIMGLLGLGVNMSWSFYIYLSNYRVYSSY